MVTITNVEIHTFDGLWKWPFLLVRCSAVFSSVVLGAVSVQSMARLTGSVGKTTDGGKLAELFIYGNKENTVQLIVEAVLFPITRKQKKTDRKSVASKKSSQFQ